MTSRETGAIDRPGERAEETRRNRFWGIMAGFLLLGGVAGATLVVMERHSGTLPGALAIGLVVLLTLSVLGGAWWFLRVIDEVEREANYIASTIALNFYLILYADWYFLWKGGLVSQPDHEALFLSTMIVMAVAYFWKKIRP
ncbi:hypothetical protein [Sphingomonas kyeonggiensis]|uniref:Uncharacterized protein n=1 Tax=Sphingomonas kyeonggiensis TaxID=1268553 RepID=A0A7W6JY32_9SPHN|nr:hypothetical protein [Sphingomonas kyeonggiensis]MBB4100550.1 hypothetical protein [Sphingomonas kyeonggiensis]